MEAMSQAAKRKSGDLSIPDAAEKPVKRKYEMDPDILDCPICSDLLSPPVFQRVNGHTVCSGCRTKLLKCPSCSEQINLRCRAVEKIIESLLVSCKYASKGCTEMVKSSEREEHEEELCQYQSIQCPMPGCSHEGLRMAMSRHLRENHQVATSKSPYDDLKVGLSYGFNLQPVEENMMVVQNDRLFFCHKKITRLK